MNPFSAPGWIFPYVPQFEGYLPVLESINVLGIDNG